MKVFVYWSIVIYYSVFIPPSFFRHLIFFLLQNACDKSSYCQNNATCQSGFTLKGYRCLCPPGFNGERCEIGRSLSQHLKWRICEILSDFQCWYDNCPSVGENGVNLSHCMLCWIFPKERESSRKQPAMFQCQIYWQSRTKIIQCFLFKTVAPI